MSVLIRDDDGLPDDGLLTVAAPSEKPHRAAAQAPDTWNPLAALLASGQGVFGRFTVLLDQSASSVKDSWPWPIRANQSTAMRFTF